jgi:hypothetical protein
VAGHNLAQQILARLAAGLASSSLVDPSLPFELDPILAGPAHIVHPSVVAAFA